MDELGFTEVKKGMTAEQAATLPGHKRSKYPPVEFDRIYLSPALVKKMKTPAPWGQVHRASWKHSDHRMVTVDLPFN
jgi:hypothetical protein